MISKKYLLLLLVLPILLLSLTAINVSAPFPTPWVKVFVDEPLGYTPFQAVGTKFSINLKIQTSGVGDAVPGTSIVGWMLDFQINPNVLDVNNTLNVCPGDPTPPFCFPPPPPPKAALVGAVAGYVMYDYDLMMSREGGPSLLSGTPDLNIGLWPDISEIYVPLGTGGFGDYMTSVPYGGPAPLVTFQVTSKSNTIGSLINIFDVSWLDDTNTWHPVDVVVDGYYGTPPPAWVGPGYMSSVGPVPLNDPVNTQWHELYPAYCNTWTMTDWADNGDGYLSASDQIEMKNSTGWVHPYHVDDVTTTIHWTFKTPLEGTGDAEPDDALADMENPIGSYWHQLYPDYSRRFKITSWDDNGDGVFGVSDQFDFVYEDDPTTYWAHLDEITTDIIISQKGAPWEEIPEFPLGLTLMLAITPAIPIVYLWRLRKKEVAK